MLSRRLIKSILIGGSFLFAVSSCSMVKETDESRDSKIVATYDGREITRGEVEGYYLGLEPTLKQKYGEDYKSNQDYINTDLKSFSENYAMQEILKDELSAQNIATEEEIDEEVNQAMDVILHNYLKEPSEPSIGENGEHIHPEEDLDMEALNKDLLAASFIDLNDFEEKRRDMIMIDRVYDHVVKDISVTEEEISDYYESNKESQFTQGPGAEISHILVDTKDEALVVIDRINNGEKYEDLAKELNKDSTSQTGGSLGFIEYDDQNYDPDFMEGAKNLKEGELSEPVETQFGYHIIKVDGIKSEVGYDTLESVETQIEQILNQTKQQEALVNFQEELFKEKNLKIK